MPIKTIIIEDEKKSRCLLEEMILRFATDLDVCGTASHMSGAIQLIETTKPQLIFLDVRIGDGTGFDVLKKISSRSFELIFVTAYDNYAIEAFRYAAIDYLLKPISIPVFEEAVDRAREKISNKNRSNSIDTLLQKMFHQNEKGNKIGVPTSYGLELVDIADITWCKSDGSYTTFYLTNKSKIVSSNRIGVYEELLCANNFYRIHNGTIINMKFVKSYIKGKTNYIVMLDGTELQVAQRRKGDFLDKLLI
jgi:two-component system LytT family response regulator